MIMMITPSGSPATLTRLSNIGCMKPGAAMNRNPTKANGRKPTT